MLNLNLNLKKFTLQMAGVFTVIVILLGFSFFQFTKESERLEVDFFDVGQGDAILIKTPSHQKILIDGGPSSKVIYKLGESLPFYEKQIDLVILTHPHADHLTGLIEVLKRYKVKKILSTGVLHTTSEYLEWLEETKNQGVPMGIAKSGQIIDLGENLQMEVLYPLEDFSGRRVENLNNTSIVLKLIYGNTSFLLVGDAEVPVEEELINAGVDLSADVLKVGHQGSKDATSQKFLEKVQPQIAVISVGENNYGHPSETVINRLERMGAEILRTDRDGDIKILSNRVKVEIKNQ